MRTAEEMREMMSAWEDSGLTQREFAEEEGLSYTAFQYWRRRLKEVDEEPSAEIVPLRIVDDGASTRASDDRIEIRFKDGVAVVVPRDFDDDQLRRVVEALRAC